MQRVLRFVGDWHSHWTDTKESGSADAWNTAIDALRDEHFAPDAACPSTGFTENAPEHAPGKERIIEKSDAGSTATIRTERASGTPLFFEYELVRNDDGWKIRNLHRATNKFPPIAGSPPLIAAEQRPKLLERATPDAALRALPPGTEPDCDRLFVDREVTVRGETISIEVHEVGALRVDSGVIAVQDFISAEGRSVTPLARRIPAGTYPVDIAFAVELGVPIAIRVRLRTSRRGHGIPPTFPKAGT